MDNYELDSFSPTSTHKLLPNRGPPASIPPLSPNSSRQSHLVPIQWQEDHKYIPLSVTNDYELDSLSHKLSPNRGPSTSTSMPLLDSQQSQIAPNRTLEYNWQVMSLRGKLLAVAKLSALPILASLYLVFCVISHKRLIALKSNGLYAFSPDHIGWLFFLEVVRLEELIASLSSKLQSKLALHHSASLSFLQPFTQCTT